MIHPGRGRVTSFGIGASCFSKMNIEHRTSNAQRRMKNTITALRLLPKSRLFVHFYSKFNVERSMFDVHLSFRNPMRLP